MSSNHNPPQLQLSLPGHQTFKRSFTQFGLDVDDAEDARSEGASSASTSSSSSSSNASSGDSIAGNSGSRSVSSGSSYSSPGGTADLFRYNDGERSERNKRARSEGPEREAVVSVSGSSNAASPGSESMEVASISSSNFSIPASSGSGSDSVVLDISPSSHNSLGGQTIDIVSHPQEASSYYQPSSINYNTTSGTGSGFTLPVLDFGPSTPSVAEFVALRSSSSPSRSSSNTQVMSRAVTRTRTRSDVNININPPGFEGMLSPRSSSPAPPPAIEIDVAMRDEDDSEEDDEEDPINLLGSRRSGGRHRRPYPPQHTTSIASTSATSNGNGSGFLDTARSDALLNTATERLRSAMERARNFDRMLAPLRSDIQDGQHTNARANAPASTGLGPGVGRGLGRGVGIGGEEHRHREQQGSSRPRLPPFDFEARRRHSPFPLRANTSTDSNPSSFDRILPRRPIDSTGLSGSTSSAGNVPTSVVQGNGRLSLPPFRDPLYFSIDHVHSHDGQGLASEHGDDNADGDSDVSEEEDEDEDDIIVDRELTVDPFPDSDPDLHEMVYRPQSENPFTIDISSFGSEDRSMLSNRSNEARDTGSRLLDVGVGIGISPRARTREILADQVRERSQRGNSNDGNNTNNNNILTDRTIDDLTSFISTSETEDDARLLSSRFFDSTSELDSRLSVEESVSVGVRNTGVGGGGRASTRLQAALSSSRRGSTAQAQIRRPRLLPNSVFVRPRTTEQDGEEQRAEANGGRFRGWPWNGLLNLPTAELPAIPGLQAQSTSASASASQTHTQTQSQARTTQQNVSPRLQLRPQSPLFPLPLSLNPRSLDARSPDADSEVRSIERMVEMDMETNVEGRYLASLHHHPSPSPTRDHSVLNRLRGIGNGQGQRVSPAAGARPQQQQQQQQQARQNLPTLRSVILGSGRGDREDRNEDGDGFVSHFADLLRQSEMDRSTQARASTNIGSGTNGVSPTVSGAGLRSRASQGGHGPIRPSILDIESQGRERLMRFQREFPSLYDRRITDEDPGLTLPNPSHVSPSLPRPTRTNSNGGTEQLIAHTRDNAEVTERRRNFLQNWFPPIYEEDRIRDEQTRMRELREQHRLSVPVSSRMTPSRSLWNRQERPTAPARPQGQNQSQRESLDELRWANSWEDVLRPIDGSGSLEADLFRPSTSDAYLRTGTEADLNDSVNNDTASSTEAAAFFASGPSYGASRQQATRPSAMLRHRRPGLPADLDEDRLRPTLGNGPWDDLEMDSDPWFSLGVADEHRLSSAPYRSNTIDASNIMSPSDHLLSLVYSRRGLQENDTISQRQANSASSNESLSARRASNGSDSNDLPSLEESRVRNWNSLQSSLRREQTGGSSSRPTRSTSLRNTSRPPSLPPLHFDRLTATSAEASENAETRLFGSGSEDSASSMNRPIPWRTLTSRFEGHGRSVASNNSLSNAQNDLQRNSDVALHHAMVLRSVQARQAAIRDSSERYRNGTATPTNRPPGPGRTQGFQDAMDILGADGLSTSIRQQFSSAFDRERNNQARTRLPRNDTHVRWGEITEDDTDTRPPTHSPRPWTETLRARRRSVSALFAPPPENADSLPPNRARGTGTAAGDVHGQSQGGSQLDWFSMISSSRARARHRARLARNEDEAPSRSFFRFGRTNRTNLRNLGDFVRDEDFDTSYESLIALAATLGDVKPRSTPAHIIGALPTGLYKDWQSPGCDLRCPICLDDYKDIDPLLKAEPCNHWCHKECLEQWLHTASTCPVCRTKIKPSQRVATPPPVAGPSRHNRTENLDDVVDDSDDDLSFLSTSPRGMSRALFELFPADHLPRSPPH